MTNTNHYKLAEIADRSGDLSKDWFCYFYAFNPKKNKLVRVRCKSGGRFGVLGSGNVIKTLVKRRAWFRKLRTEINKALQNGYRPTFGGRVGVKTAAGNVASIKNFSWTERLLFEDLGGRMDKEINKDLEEISSNDILNFLQLSCNENIILYNETLLNVKFIFNLFKELHITKSNVCKKLKESELEQTTIKEAFNLAIERKRLKGVTANKSLSNYKGLRLRLHDFLEGKYIETVTKKDIENFLKLPHFQTGQPVSNNTYNNKRRDLRALFNECIELDIIANNPVLDVPTRRAVEPLKNGYSNDLIIRTLAAAKKYNLNLWLCIHLVYYALIRPNSEGRLIQRCDIDFKNNTIRIQPDKAKTADFRAVHLHPSLRTALVVFGVEQMKAEQYIFTRPAGGVYADDYFSKKFTDMKRLKGHEFLKGFTLYAFKDTAATAIYKATGDIFLVSKLCGHKNVKTTIRYIRLNAGDVSEAGVSILPDFQ